MGCCSTVPTPPEDPTPEQKRRLEELRNLWSPGSIWFGTINIEGKEVPWEIHVKRDSTPRKISAKRVTNFAQATFTDAIIVGFEHDWEEMKDAKGKHAGFREIITFRWEDDEYKVFSDTIDGIIDIKERRIRGLVVYNQTGDTGSVDFTRVMYKTNYGDECVVHKVSYDWKENDPRAARVGPGLEKANEVLENQKRRLTGVHQTSPLQDVDYSNSMNSP